VHTQVATEPAPPPTERAVLRLKVRKEDRVRWHETVQDPPRGGAVGVAPRSIGGSPPPLTAHQRCFWILADYSGRSHGLQYPLGLRGARFFLDRGFGNSGVRRLLGRSGTLHPRRSPREGCYHHPVAFPSVRLFAFVLPHHFISSSKFRRASPPPLASPDISLVPPRSQPQPEDLQDLLYVPNRPETTPFHQRLPSSPCVGLPRGFRKAPLSPQHARKFAPGVKAGRGGLLPPFVGLLPVSVWESKIPFIVGECYQLLRQRE